MTVDVLAGPAWFGEVAIYCLECAEREFGQEETGVPG
jgi:hypothetical protein